MTQEQRAVIQSREEELIDKFNESEDLAILEEINVLQAILIYSQPIESEVSP